MASFLDLLLRGGLNQQQPPDPAGFVPFDQEGSQAWATALAPGGGPSWTTAYHGGYQSLAPLPTAPIDESRFWRQPTFLDRVQQGFGGAAAALPGWLDDWAFQMYQNRPSFPDALRPPPGLPFWRQEP